MSKISFATGALGPDEQTKLKEGFASHSQKQNAPLYNKEHVNWTVKSDDDNLIAVLTADILWEWLYIDELWVADSYRGAGLGKQLMKEAEKYAINQNLSGVWLWTQSWQAPDFYKNLGFEEFTRFESFPAEHSRIGLRKYLSKTE